MCHCVFRYNDINPCINRVPPKIWKYENMKICVTENYKLVVSYRSSKRLDRKNRDSRRDIIVAVSGCRGVIDWLIGDWFLLFVCFVVLVLDWYWIGVEQCWIGVELVSQIELDWHWYLYLYLCSLFLRSICTICFCWSLSASMHPQHIPHIHLWHSLNWCKFDWVEFDVIDWVGLSFRDWIEFALSW